MDQHGAALDPHHTFMNVDLLLSDTVKPFIIPIIGLMAGAVTMSVPEASTVGKLVLYFGAQSFMNIYMGWVMRTHVTVPKGIVIQSTNATLENNLTGCPAGFALTALQQLVSFSVFLVFFGAAYFTPYRYEPKKLKTGFEFFCIAVFGCVFALNIALNNFSLGYISIAVNLIIRSSLQLTTFLSQQALSVIGLYPFKPCKFQEVALMTLGVFCAGVFTWAKIMSSSQESESSNMVLGVTMCIASLLCGSLNLALAGVLGETKLNVLDTVAYMAIPATLFLAPIAYFLEKPVPGEWGKVFGKPLMTDYEILMGTWEVSPNTMNWLLLSGVFSFAYNMIQFSVVHTLSPSATAFGGNFNKAALVFLTLLLPFLRVHDLPQAPWIIVIWSAVICNIAAFGYYSYLQIQAKEEEEEGCEGKAKQLKAPLEFDDEDGCDEDGCDEEASSSSCWDGKGIC